MMHGTVRLPGGKRDWARSMRCVKDGSFRKLGVPYFGVLIIRILLFRVLY